MVPIVYYYYIEPRYITMPTDAGKQVFYALDDKEKNAFEAKLLKENKRQKVQVQRFKGLGEISPNEFKHFIGNDIRLEPVMIGRDLTSGDLLEFYMGKNTPKRQEFIIENLRVEKNLEEEFFN